MGDLVSIIIPTFNSAPVLGEALDSVVNQTYRPLEIITIDDCSGDDSYAFAKAYSQKHSSSEITFITLKNEINSGAGVTRNHGIKKSSGRYISFLDADDLWKPEKLALQIEVMSSQNAAVAYGAYEIFSDNPARPHHLQNVPTMVDFPKMLKANYVGMLTGIYDVSQLGKVYMPTIRKRQDWAMWLSITKTAGKAIGVQTVIASYRKGDGLSSNKLDLIKYNYMIYREYLGYTAMKSYLLMGRFLYEQFVVKKSYLEEL
ncbi:MAG: glycosyltransferase family 2 protein [Nonlabens sp.]